MNVLRSSLLPALLLPALLVLAPSTRADTINLVGGRQVTGISITAETYQTVEYSKGRVRQKQAASDVVSVVYSKTTKEYQEGLAALEAGDNIKAAQYFVTAADDDLPAHIKATALASAAEALLANNNFADAQGIYAELLSNHPDTRHLAPALLGQGKALFYHGDLQGAEAAFNSLKKQAADKSLGERWELEAEFYALWSAEQRGKDVLDDYRRLQTKAESSDPALARQCGLNLARAELKKGQGERAQRLFEEIIDGRMEAGRDVVAGAFNGRGDCIFARGAGFMNAGDEYRDDALAAFRQAQFDYLRVYVMYKGVTREQPQALLGAAKCFLNIASLDPEAEDADYRGRVLLKQLRDGYAWSKQAKDAEALR